MYERFFGLNEKPFNVTPDPRYLYLTEGHQEALAHLTYGVQEQKGFVLLTGEVGMGKTTLLRTFLEGLEEEVKTALVFHSRASFSEILRQVCTDFGLSVESSGKVAMLGELNRFLLDCFARKETVVLIIDEAQNLSTSALEEIRLLSNLETSRAKLLQLILVGQPELEAKLDRPELRQLRQRIGLRCRLSPMGSKETTLYIQRRLEIAGAREMLFTPGALKEVYRFSQGVPRLINLLCDNALLSAYSEESKQVGRAFIREAARDLKLQGEKGVGRARSKVAASLAALLLSFLLIGSGLYFFQPSELLDEWVGPVGGRLVTVIHSIGMFASKLMSGFSSPEDSEENDSPTQLPEDSKGKADRSLSPVVGSLDGGMPRLLMSGRFRGESFLAESSVGEDSSPLSEPKNGQESPRMPIEDDPIVLQAEDYGSEAKGRPVESVSEVERFLYKPSLIRWVQEVLRRQGFYEGEISGRLDDRTTEAVRAFQRVNSLAPVGLPGPLTRAALRSVDHVNGDVSSGSVAVSE